MASIMKFLTNMSSKRFLSTTQSKLPNHVTQFINKRLEVKCFEQIFINKWKLIEAPEDKGICIFELKVDETLANASSFLHGGAICSLVDCTTTVALFNTPIRKPGVSVNINISFLKAIKINETILIEAKVNKLGGKLAFLESNFYLKDKDSYELKQDLLVAKGSHTKYIIKNF